MDASSLSSVIMEGVDRIFESASCATRFIIVAKLLPSELIFPTPTANPSMPNNELAALAAKDEFEIDPDSEAIAEIRSGLGDPKRCAAIGVFSPSPVKRN